MFIDSIEWNYRFLRLQNPEHFNDFYGKSENLSNNYSKIINEEVMQDYSKNWKRPQVYKDFEKTKENGTNKDAFELETKEIEGEPKGAQIEALYELENSRGEGFDKGLVVAATGIGKANLAAFDSIKAERVLFVAHREEIIKQAARSFKNVKKSEEIGFFYNSTKDNDKAMIFALVQTLGKEEYLKEEYFKRDYFDYNLHEE